MTGIDRSRTTPFPEHLEDFVDALELLDLGFMRAAPAATGGGGYDLAVLLKLYVYGYLSRIPSSWRLEREAGRNSRP